VGDAKKYDIDAVVESKYYQYDKVMNTHLDRDRLLPFIFGPIFDGGYGRLKNDET
jgi:hypothetical protein